MLKALLHGKLGRAANQAADSEALSQGWRDAITRSEDCLTSLVFARLAYLRPDTLRNLFSGWGLEKAPDRLSNIEFWPGHRSDESSRVEPDVVFMDANSGTAWIFEVKWIGSTLYESQLERERAAARLAMEGYVLHLVGVARDDVGRLLPDYSFLRWSDLPPVVRKLRAATREEDPEKRILQDLLESLSAFRIGLSELTTLPPIALEYQFYPQGLNTWITPRTRWINLTDLSRIDCQVPLTPTILRSWIPIPN